MWWSSCTQPSHPPPQSGWMAGINCTSKAETVARSCKSWRDKYNDGISERILLPTPPHRCPVGTSFPELEGEEMTPFQHKDLSERCSSVLSLLCTCLTSPRQTHLFPVSGLPWHGPSAASLVQKQEEWVLPPWMCWLKSCEGKHSSCPSNQVPSPITCSVQKAPRSNPSSLEFAGDLISVSKRNGSRFVPSLQLNTAVLCSADVQEGR